jgi:hypothetical protein
LKENLRKTFFVMSFKNKKIIGERYMAINLRDYDENRFQAQCIFSNYETERHENFGEILYHKTEDLSRNMTRKIFDTHKIVTEGYGITVSMDVYVLTPDQLCDIIQAAMEEGSKFYLPRNFL